MLKRKTLTWVLCAVGIVVSIGCAFAQTYPYKPIRIITGGVGGGSDYVARMVAHDLTALLGQQVIVDNRGAGVIPGQIVSKAPPDGYTLLLYTNTLWIGPFLQETPYDPVRDFSPITLTNMAPNVLVVAPSLQVNSVSQLIALAKAKPRTLNYGAAGIGGSAHLAAELFKAMAGVDIVHVNYKSGGMLATDLLGGQVQLSIGSAGTMMPHVNSGKLKALAVSSLQPSALFPGLPTIAASGLPGYESASMQGLFAPAKTPQALINILNQAVVKIVSTPDVKEKLLKGGQEPGGSSPEGLAAKIRSEMNKLGRVIKDAGIGVQQ